MFSGNAANNTVQLDGVYQSRGGISVVFSGNAANNTVQLDGVCIENNEGSGISLAFRDNTNGNTVTINGADVIQNTIPLVYSNMVYIPLIVYSIWNLNFLTLYPIPFCLPLVDTAAGVILLQYVIAACPLVFIIMGSR